MKHSKEFDCVVCFLSGFSIPIMIMFAFWVAANGEF